MNVSESIYRKNSLITSYIHAIRLEIEYMHENDITFYVRFYVEYNKNLKNFEYSEF